jgi:hypothetical protein
VPETVMAGAPGRTVWPATRYSDETLAVVAASPVVSPVASPVVALGAVFDASRGVVLGLTEIAVMTTPPTVSSCAVLALVRVAVSRPSTIAVAPCARLMLVPDMTMADDPGFRVWSPKTYSEAALTVAVASPKIRTDETPCVIWGWATRLVGASLAVDSPPLVSVAWVVPSDCEVGLPKPEVCESTTSGPALLVGMVVVVSGIWTD